MSGFHLQLGEVSSLVGSNNLQKLLEAAIFVARFNFCTNHMSLIYVHMYNIHQLSSELTGETLINDPFFKKKLSKGMENLTITMWA